MAQYIRQDHPRFMPKTQAEQPGNNTAVETLQRKQPGKPEAENPADSVAGEEDPGSADEMLRRGPGADRH